LVEVKLDTKRVLYLLDEVLEAVGGQGSILGHRAEEIFLWQT
jgi:hypothetical protein